jgi:hypothetical protein
VVRFVERDHTSRLHTVLVFLTVRFCLSVALDWWCRKSVRVWDALPFQVPDASNGAPWKVVVNTSMPAPEDIYDACCGPPIHDSEHVIVGGRSVMVLVAGRTAA